MTDNHTPAIIPVTNVVHSTPMVDEPQRTIVDWLVQKAVTTGRHVSITTVPIFEVRVAVIDIAETVAVENPDQPHGLGTKPWAGILVRETGCEVLSNSNEISHEIAGWVSEIIGILDEGADIRVSTPLQAYEEAAPFEA